MKASVFTPTVTVFDDGQIEVNFVDSYSHSIDSENGRCVYDAEDLNAESHIALLDAVLGTSVYPPTRLRRLAEYIRTWSSCNKRKSENRVRKSLREIGELMPESWKAGK